MIKKITIKNALYFIVLASFLVPLVAFSVIGSYSRATGDDYCNSAISIGYGVIGGAYNYYTTWTGKFTSDLVWNLIGQTRFHIIPYMPLIYILLFSTGAFLTINQIQFSIQKRAQRYLSFVLSSAILVSLFGSMPRIEQSVYWANGAVNYLLPIVVFSYYCLGIVAWWNRRGENKKKFSSLFYVLAFLLPFIAGGLNETFVVMEVALFGLTLAGILIFTKEKNRRDLLLFFSFSLLGSLAALAFVFFAPGNAFRQAFYPPPPDILTMLKISLKGFLALFDNILAYFSRLLSLSGLLVLSSMAGAFVLRRGQSKIESKPGIKLFLFLLPIVSAILIFVCYVPGAYGESAVIPDRSMSIPVFVLVVGIAIWGFLWGFLHGQELLRGINQKAIATILVILCLFISSFPLYDSYRAWREAAQLRTYASQWDKSNAQILMAKQDGATLIKIDPLIKWGDIENFGTDPSLYHNICASNSYGITIQTK